MFDLVKSYQMGNPNYKFLNSIYEKVPREELDDIFSGRETDLKKFLIKHSNSYQAYTNWTSAVAGFVMVKDYQKTKQVFSFDKDMVAELARTDTNVILPKGVFNYLPCDIFYLDFSANKDICKKMQADGALVSIKKYIAEDGTQEERYRLLEMYFQNENLSYMTRLHFRNVDCDISKIGTLEYKDNAENIPAPIASATEESMNIQRILTLQSLIYLSSVEPDIRETTASKASRASFRNQKNKGNKKTDRPPQVYSVGERFGEAFRSWTNGQLDVQNKSQSTGRHNKPHFRKAHWHRYWVGKRDSDERQLVVKWVHQCLCGDKEREVDTVKHKVHKQEERE